jgi:hypothetical protein
MNFGWVRIKVSDSWIGKEQRLGRSCSQHNALFPSPFVDQLYLTIGPSRFVGLSDWKLRGLDFRTREVVS